MIFAAFLNNNPVFKSFFHHLPITPCNQIEEREIDDFIKKQVQKLDLFIYIPVSDDYRNDYKFSSNFFLSHLRQDCVKIAFPSLFYNVYDRQMTYLTDEQGNRIHVPSDYHDKILIKMFMTYRHLKNEEIYQKYIEYINNYENFSKTELEKAATSNYNELKRREYLLEKDKKNDFVLTIADFINENYQDRRLFYTLNHPSKYIYLHLMEQLFRYLKIENNKENIDPNLDPHTDFVFGIFPPVRKYLGLRFEDQNQFPANTVSYKKYLEFYRSFSMETLAMIGIYPESGTYIFKMGWSEDEITHRWAVAKSAKISVFNDYAEPINYKLFFTLFVLGSQDIGFFLNAIYLKTVEFNGDKKTAFINLNIQLRPGENILEISSDVDPVSPGTGDGRMLSFAISQFSVVKDSEFLP